MCDPSHVAQVRDLHVEPAWLGQGVAHRLLEAAARYARECGSLKLVLEAHSLLQRVAELLADLGFRHVGDRHQGPQRLMDFYLDLYHRPERRSALWH